jgi:sortase A
MTAATGMGDRLGDGLNRFLAGVRERRGSSPSRPVHLTGMAVTATWAALALAGLALWTTVFGLGLSALSEHHDQHTLYATFRQNVADGVAPVGGAMPRGKPVTMLDAAAGGLHGLVAVEGTTSSDLRSGPGHYPGSVLPGQPGVSIFFGRSASFGGPFGSITKLRRGDVITATTQQGRFSYTVEDVRGPGDPLSSASGRGLLVLVTSEGSGWRSLWAPSHAVFVDAVLSGPTAPAPSSVGVTHAGDLVMHGDTGQLVWLLLWMQLLVICVIGAVVAASRWDFWRVWMVAAPVLLAVLWGTTQTGWALLPNVI